MSTSCHEQREFIERGLEHRLDHGEEARWQEHLEVCVSCREQAAADDALRRAFGSEPLLGFADDLDRRLEENLVPRLRDRLYEREARHAGPARHLASKARWALAGYGLAASLASFVILARVPWQVSLPESVGSVVGILIGSATLLAPIVLLDRRGVILPP